jgi:hypothetical protein
MEMIKHKFAYTFILLTLLVSCSDRDVKEKSLILSLKNSNEILRAICNDNFNSITSNLNSVQNNRRTELLLKALKTIKDAKINFENELSKISNQAEMLNFIKKFEKTFDEFDKGYTNIGLDRTEKTCILFKNKSSEDLRKIDMTTVLLILKVDSNIIYSEILRDFAFIPEGSLQ